MSSLKSQTIRLLRWSEKYTKTDMVYLANGGFWLLFGQAVVFILSFGLLWFFANYLDKDTYGQYRFLVTVVSILSITSLISLGTAYINAVAKNKTGGLSLIISTKITYSLIGSAAALIGAGYYFWQGDMVMTIGFLLIAVALPVFDTFNIYTHYHNGRKDYQNFTATTIMHRCFVVLATVCSILLTKHVLIIFATFLVATAISHYLLYKWTLKEFPPNNEMDNNTIPYGKKLTLLNSLGTVAAHFDKIALWYLAGPVQVASYIIAVSLPTELHTAMSQVGKLALPKLAATSARTARESLLRKSFIFLLGTIPIIILYILVAPVLFTYLLPQYTDVIRYSQVAALFIATAPVTLLHQYFLANMNTKTLFVSQFIQPVLSIIILLIAVPLWGIWGAIFALLLKQIIVFIIYLYFYLTEEVSDHHHKVLS